MLNGLKCAPESILDSYKKNMQLPTFILTYDGPIYGNNNILMDNYIPL